MVSSALTPDRMTVVDGPSKLFRLGAVVLPVLGLLVAGSLAWQVLVPRTGWFRCDRARDRCAMEAGRRDWAVALAELRGARVAEHHRHKVGTMYQLDLVLASGRARDIGRPTSHEQTAAEYREAAAAIDAFLAGSEPRLEVSWLYRVGFGESWRLGLTAAFLLLAGVLMLAIWARRSCELDRHSGQVTLVRSGPLRPRRTRAVAVAEVTAVRERDDRGRVTIELELGRERWVLIAGEPAARPGLAEARRVLAQGLGRAGDAAG